MGGGRMPSVQDEPRRPPVPALASHLQPMLPHRAPTWDARPARLRAMDEHRPDDDLRPNETADAETDAAADEELHTTADHWREPLRGTEAEDSADEVARGAEQATEQPGYGREGS